MTYGAGSWPPLGAVRDGATIATLHLYSQVVGKVAVALLPWRNHGWHATLHLHPRGLRTEPLHGPGGVFELDLDLAEHRLVIETAGGNRTVPLPACRTVAEFFAQTTVQLRQAGHAVDIHPSPNEISPAVRFADDHAPRTYDTDSAARLLRALLDADRVFRRFRSAFLGKVSPVHFFWGSFDLAVTRFSGRPAPSHPGGIPNLPDAITREAYSHEVSSAGFWPGGAMGGDPMFYSYAYPNPPRFASAAVEPEAARWDAALGEFVLGYDDVRGARDPDARLLQFLTSTYAAAADLGRWERSALECPIGRPGTPRELD